MTQKNDSILPSDEFINNLFKDTAKRLGFEYEIPESPIDKTSDENINKILEEIKKNKANSVAYQTMVNGQQTNNNISYLWD